MAESLELTRHLLTVGSFKTDFLYAFIPPDYGL